MSDSTHNPETPPQTSGSMAMIRALSLVAAISGALIVTAYQLTLPIIKANKAEALHNAVFTVLPHTQRVETYKLEPDGSLVPLKGEDEKAVKVYAGYDGKDLVGVAIEARGQGYQDTIKVIYGYSPQKHSIVGMKVLESKETPGLGDKIGKDPDFLANFKDLDVQLNPQGTGLLHPLQVVKKGAKTEKWQIDAITGATISSKAVGKLLNHSAQVRVPQVEKNLERIKEGQ